MDGKTYVGCLGVVAVLALVAGAPAGAIGLLVASKFIVPIVLVTIGLVVLTVVRRR